MVWAGVAHGRTGDSLTRRRKDWWPRVGAGCLARWSETTSHPLLRCAACGALMGGAWAGVAHEATGDLLTRRRKGWWPRVWGGVLTVGGGRLG